MKVLFALIGLLLIGASLVPSTISASPASPTRNFSIGPTPTPIAGLQKHP